MPSGVVGVRHSGGLHTRRRQFGHAPTMTGSGATCTATHLPQQRLLKSQMKRAYGAFRRWEHLPQVCDGLQQGGGTLTNRGRCDAAQCRTHHCQTPPQSLQQVVERVQREGRPQEFPCRLDRHRVRAQCRQHIPQPRRGGSMTRHHPCQQQSKRAPTTATLPAIGAEYPLTSVNLALCGARIIAVTPAMPVQRADAAAVGTTVLFEGKRR